ncbi:hypothetical protein [Kangiella shandongensis]|uniref:hypothetical protein n=1 Tax=Kangiella shandongensis TaxID=2763258 RepID=UPI001CBC02BA|nr:hypothetical protein [Kangiella shandongensis]
MPRIIAKPDNLNELNKNYTHKKLETPVFLNSVPKCGTHLIRNIFRMFVPVEQQYHKAFVQIPILRQHLEAYNLSNPKLSWGHLLFSDESAMALHGVKQILVVRDPYDWVLARTRFFLSDSFQGQLEHLRNGKFTVEQIFNMMIFGIYQKAPTLYEIFTHNAVSWLSSDIKVVKFEDLIYHVKNIDTPEAKNYFEDLLSVTSYSSLPEDWKERIKVGSDRKQSGTARENLFGNKFELPDELPDAQKQMVDYAAPGLRKILGYE